MKSALITGSSSPLGQIIAKHLSQYGYDIGIHYHKNRDDAKLLLNTLEKSGGSGQILQADLSQESQCISLLDSWLGEKGSLQILVNNSGVYHAQSLEELTETHWLSGFHTTATSVFFMSRAALPYLRKSSDARIINIGDSSCDRIGARNLAMSYHIGKTGVLMLTKSFAQQEAQHHITVNMISPGYMENSINLPEPDSIPARRFGTGSDLTRAIDFLISPESDYCTGSNLILSGGWNL